MPVGVIADIVLHISTPSAVHSYASLIILPERIAHDVAVKFTLVTSQVPMNWITRYASCLSHTLQLNTGNLNRCYVQRCCVSSVALLTDFWQVVLAEANQHRLGASLVLLISVIPSNHARTLR